MNSMIYFHMRPRAISLHSTQPMQASRLDAHGLHSPDGEGRTRHSCSLPVLGGGKLRHSSSRSSLPRVKATPGAAAGCSRAVPSLLGGVTSCGGSESGFHLLEPTVGIWGEYLAKNDRSSAKELPALQEGRKPHMAQLQCPPPCVLAGMEPPKDPPTATEGGSYGAVSPSFGSAPHSHLSTQLGLCPTHSTAPCPGQPRGGEAAADSHTGASTQGMAPTTLSRKFLLCVHREFSLQRTALLPWTSSGDRKLSCKPATSFCKQGRRTSSYCRAQQTTASLEEHPVFAAAPNNASNRSLQEACSRGW